MIIKDPADYWDIECEKREKWRESRPVCETCEERITGDIYDTPEGYMCEGCAYDCAMDEMESWRISE